jgi:phosphoribosylanthranilate isomerase
MRTRVKICGITRVEDARQAAQLGADAIGLVFCQASPRNVSIEQARSIANALPPFVSRAGLFVDADAEHIDEVLSSVAIDLLQFHGSETADQCNRYNVPYIKAIRMAPGLELKDAIAAFPDARGYLLDSYSPMVAGGSGETFDWERVPSGIDSPLILAGGLDTENVGRAIETVRPYAVDVSSGVEQRKGIKDAAKMAAFINEVNKYQ